MNDACVACGKPRPEKAVEQDDPFCSTECCRAYYGAVRRSDEFGSFGSTPGRPRGYTYREQVMEGAA